jgi:hypothetical protein
MMSLTKIASPRFPVASRSCMAWPVGTEVYPNLAMIVVARVDHRV